MLLGFLCLLVLCGAWLSLRQRPAPDDRVETWRSSQSRLQIALGALLVLGSAFPLFRLAPWVKGGANFLPADAASHSRVAAEIARVGLPHGWIDSYLGGFPFGHHYPPLGWLLLALEMRGGLSPALATNSLGFVTTLATPLVLYVSCVRAGARPAFAACGGCLLAVLSPYNSFVGGFETYFAAGLVSQTLALPLCIAFGAAVQRGARAESVVLGALGMLAHPQLCGATVFLLASVALIDGARGRRATVACALASAVVVGLAAYGQGIATLRVPFGWPAGMNWRQLGFGTARLDWWFRDGDLLDRGASTPSVTSLSLAALLTCALLVRRRAPRAVLLLAFAGVVASSTGTALAHSPKLGGLILEVIQPLRMLALLPPIFATALVVALQEGMAALPSVRWPRQLQPRELPVLLATATALGVLAFALPQRLQAASALAGLRSAGAAAFCGIDRSDESVLGGWLERLSGGSLWFDDGEEQSLSRCLQASGLELASAVPIATTSSVGAHVGMLWLASRELQPERGGAAARAEALGVRYLIQKRRADRSVPAGFVREKSRGEIELLKLAAGAQAHVGCVRERWTGSNNALRDRLTRELSALAGADRLLDPLRFTELSPGSGEVTTELVKNDCDASRANLRLVAREPGAIEAEVTSEASVDVAFHASAFPAWRVSVDGAAGVPAHTIAPGYFYVHVARGQHRLLAIAGSMPGYGAWLAVAALVVAALAWLDARRAFRAVRSRLLGARARIVSGAGRAR